MTTRYTRHEDHPPLEERRVELAAECYNGARLALLRGGDRGPVWLDLPGLPGLKLALMPDAWVVADWNRGQLPLMAWVDFRPAADRALHQAVPCGFRVYAGAADRMVDRVTTVMRRQLRAHLKCAAGAAQVIPLPAPRGSRGRVAPG